MSSRARLTIAPPRLSARGTAGAGQTGDRVLFGLCALAGLIVAVTASIEPATGGCRNITGVVNRDGTATIYAITSTISNNGDNGADPNKLVKVTDLISATQPAKSGNLDTFVTIRSARAGEAFRGVALAPEEDGFFFGPAFPMPFAAGFGFGR